MSIAHVHELWVVTSYFNPCGYGTRRDNYRKFREHLRAPLLTVELGYDDRFDLSPSDATRLIQLQTDQIMWQKERLLNIALANLPDECRYVAWIDCDVVFERADWVEAAASALAEHVLIQPYSTIYDLACDARVIGTDPGDVFLQRRSMASRYVDGSIDYGGTSTCMLGHYSPGHAWAVRRDAVHRSGLYDAMILGSGDFAIAMAAIGRQNDVVDAFSMNPRQAGHYLLWSEQWHRRVQGSIGCVEGGLFHLWHGRLQDRAYDRRYVSFDRFQFDPLKDIEVADNGCWRWSSNKTEMHRYVRQYFESRKEGGGQESRGRVASDPRHS